jgi:hypothetical protein
MSQTQKDKYSMFSLICGRKVDLRKKKGLFAGENQWKVGGGIERELSRIWIKYMIGIYEKIKIKPTFRNHNFIWGCSSVVEYMPSMHEALDTVPFKKKKKRCNFF